ncbi:GNAT family N-acetyltransferase [Nocardia sp. BMG51109]|uniref:GNAT family N-acetyltransferase n=1 Tax=Nocardia sp. BMG51109 TaxID=1056816 RepID=UPI000462F1B4|nr:GNAT family N-acetyltransferase [Nocardia sp. BMG51109]
MPHAPRPGPGDWTRSSRNSPPVNVSDRCRALEIGYWVHAERTGRGVSTRSVAAPTEAALVLPGVEHIQIRCDAANIRSAAVPRRLGYRLDRFESRTPRAPAETGRDMIRTGTRNSRVTSRAIGKCRCLGGRRWA